MAAIGATAFAILLWGSILGVFLAFAFEVYALACDLGWLGKRA